MKKTIAFLIAFTLTCFTASANDLTNTNKAPIQKDENAIIITKNKNKIEQLKAEAAGIVEAVTTVTNNTADPITLEELSIANFTQYYEAYDECRYSYFEAIRSPRKFRKEYNPSNKEIKKLFEPYKLPLNPFTKFQPVVLQPGESYTMKRLIKNFYQPKVIMKAKNNLTQEVYQHIDNY